MLATGSQGYLGILPGDIDNDRAAALKLKTVAGAEIITVDRDGPACKAGLRVHDVILQMNGQPVAGQEQLRRMLRETPAGRAITLVISREGHQQTVTIQLADRSTVEQDAWTQHMIVPAPDDDDAMVIAGPSGHATSGSSGFFGVMSLGSPSVGVELDTLGSQLADYFGVKDGQGLLVKHVAENSPASRAGLKAGDVITRANGQTMATLGEWMKMLHSNRGKQVQITLIRNRIQQTVTLDDAHGKNRGELAFPEVFEPGDGAAELAQLKSGQLESTIDSEALLHQMGQNAWLEPSIEMQLLQMLYLKQQQNLADQMQ
jgi:predicted metalloprotease with PDZ domain